MKQIKYLSLGLIPLLAIILFFGFTSNNYSSYNLSFLPQPDSLHNQNGGRMMGNGMMNGGMMGRGMMGSRGMMGQGMVGQSASKNIIKNKNGNWIAPASANKLKNPLNDIAKARREGKSIFNTQCFTCHGTNGKGDGPAAMSLNPKPANLTSNKIQKQSDGAIFWKITNGNSPMPSFKYALSENQRWELVDYIRQLGK